MGNTEKINIYSTCPKCGHWCTANASANWMEKTSHVGTLISEFADEDVKSKKTKLGKLGTRLLWTVEHIPVTLLFGHSTPKDEIASFKCTCGEEWVGFGCTKEEWIQKIETDIQNSDSIVPIEKTYEMLRTIHNYRGVDIAYNDKLSELFTKLKDQYIHNFCKMPNYARRFIWVIKDNITSYPENICLFTLKEASVIDTHFENEIVTNVLYIKHPYKEIYYPKDRYSVSLFEDEVEDFIDIMACAGAKKIKIHVEDNLKNNKNDNFSSSTIKGASNGVQGQISENYESNEEKRFSRLITRTEEHHFDSAYRVRRYPQTGEFVWYDARDGWRHKVARVLEYGERTMNFTLSIQEEIFISQKETDAIQLDIQNISTDTSAGIANTESLQSILGKFHHRELIAHVEFYGEDDIKKEGKVKSFLRKIFKS